METRFSKCVEHIYFGRPCELGFSATEFRRVGAERDRVYDQLKAARAKAKEAYTRTAPLQKRLYHLEHKRLRMTEEKVQNIAELEENEAKAAAASSRAPFNDDEMEWMYES